MVHSICGVTAYSTRCQKCSAVFKVDVVEDTAMRVHMEDATSAISLMELIKAGQSFHPVDMHSSNTLAVYRKLGSQPARLFNAHATRCRDHDLALTYYKECVVAEQASGQPAASSEAHRCYELLRSGGQHASLRWAMHAWIALRHHLRKLSAYDFEASIDDHRVAGSYVYGGIYGSKEFVLDIGKAGAITVAHFQKEAIAKSPIKPNLACVDEGKGFLIERIGYFELVDGRERVYGKDHDTYAKVFEAHHSEIGVSKLRAFLADGASTNGVKESDGVENLYTALKVAHPTMLGTWCGCHIFARAAQAPQQQGSPELQEVTSGFDFFFNSYAASIVVPPDLCE